MDAILNAAPLIVAGLGSLGAFVALCIRPSEAPAITDALTKLLMICGTAWQASRSQKTGV